MVLRARIFYFLFLLPMNKSGNQLKWKIDRVFGRKTTSGSRTSMKIKKKKKKESGGFSQISLA